eukprot:scaffold3135_cov352-Prasinococcus_capsulatus_cf.AAC.9
MGTAAQSSAFAAHPGPRGPTKSGSSWHTKGSSSKHSCALAEVARTARARRAKDFIVAHTSISCHRVQIGRIV